MKPAAVALLSEMSNALLYRQLDDLVVKWNKVREGNEGMGGSPGEWIVERMADLERELDRRGARRR